MAQVPTSKKTVAKPAVKPFEPSPTKAVAETVAAPLAQPVKASKPLDAIAPAAPLAAVIVPPVEPKPAVALKAAAPVKPAVTAPVAAILKETKMNDTINQVQDTIKNTTEEATA